MRGLLDNIILGTPGTDTNHRKYNKDPPALNHVPVVGSFTPRTNHHDNNITTTLDNSNNNTETTDDSKMTTSSSFSTKDKDPMDTTTTGGRGTTIDDNDHDDDQFSSHTGSSTTGGSSSKGTTATTASTTTQQRQQQSFYESWKSEIASLKNRLDKQVQNIVETSQHEMDMLLLNAGVLTTTGTGTLATATTTTSASTTSSTTGQHSGHNNQRHHPYYYVPQIQPSNEYEIPNPLMNHRRNRNNSQEGMYNGYPPYQPPQQFLLKTDRSHSHDSSTLALPTPPTATTTTTPATQQQQQQQEKYTQYPLPLPLIQNQEQQQQLYQHQTTTPPPLLPHRSLLPLNHHTNNHNHNMIDDQPASPRSLQILRNQQSKWIKQRRNQRLQSTPRSQKKQQQQQQQKQQQKEQQHQEKPPTTPFSSLTPSPNPPSPSLRLSASNMSVSNRSERTEPQSNLSRHVADRRNRNQLIPSRNSSSNGSVTANNRKKNTTTPTTMNSNSSHSGRMSSSPRFQHRNNDRNHTPISSHSPSSSPADVMGMVVDEIHTIGSKASSELSYSSRNMSSPNHHHSHHNHHSNSTPINYPAPIDEEEDGNGTTTDDDDDDDDDENDDDNDTEQGMEGQINNVATENGKSHQLPIPETQENQRYSHNNDRNHMQQVSIQPNHQLDEDVVDDENKRVNYPPERGQGKFDPVATSTSTAARGGGGGGGGGGSKKYRTTQTPTGELLLINHKTVSFDETATTPRRTNLLVPQRHKQQPFFGSSDVGVGDRVDKKISTKEIRRDIVSEQQLRVETRDPSRSGNDDSTTSSTSSSCGDRTDISLDADTNKNKKKQNAYEQREGFDSTGDPITSSADSSSESSNDEEVSYYSEPSPTRRQYSQQWDIQPTLSSPDHQQTTHHSSEKNRFGRRDRHPTPTGGQRFFDPIIERRRQTNSRNDLTPQAIQARNHNHFFSIYERIDEIRNQNNEQAATMGAGAIPNSSLLTRGRDAPAHRVLPSVSSSSRMLYQHQRPTPPDAPVAVANCNNNNKNDSNNNDLNGSKHSTQTPKTKRVPTTPADKVNTDNGEHLIPVSLPTSSVTTNLKNNVESAVEKGTSSHTALTNNGTDLNPSVPSLPTSKVAKLNKSASIVIIDLSNADEDYLKRLEHTGSNKDVPQQQKQMETLKETVTATTQIHPINQNPSILENPKRNENDNNLKSVDETQVAYNSIDKNSLLNPDVEKDTRAIIKKSTELEGIYFQQDQHHLESPVKAAKRIFDNAIEATVATLDCLNSSTHIDSSSRSINPSHQGEILEREALVTATTYTTTTGTATTSSISNKMESRIPESNESRRQESNENLDQSTKDFHNHERSINTNKFHNEMNEKHDKLNGATDFDEMIKEFKGVIRDYNGDSGNYSGSITGRKPVGFGTMIYKDGRTYTGTWNKGRWHGHGKSIFENGDTYTGEYVKDQRHGIGRYEWNDGRVYDGNFDLDQRHGQGIYSWPDGSVYTGEFKEGLRHGEGSYTFADGSAYTGEWKNGKYHGKGECLWKDGRCYIGEWLMGRAHGYGIETKADGTIRHDGLWHENKPVRDQSNNLANRNTKIEIAETKEKLDSSTDQYHRPVAVEVIQQEHNTHNLNDVGQKSERSNSNRRSKKSKSKQRSLQPVDNDGVHTATELLEIAKVSNTLQKPEYFDSIPDSKQHTVSRQKETRNVSEVNDITDRDKVEAKKIKDKRKNSPKKERRSQSQHKERGGSTRDVSQEVPSSTYSYQENHILFTKHPLSSSKNHNLAQYSETIPSLGREKQLTVEVQANMMTQNRETRYMDIVDEFRFTPPHTSSTHTNIEYDFLNSKKYGLYSSELHVLDEPENSLSTNPIRKREQDGYKASQNGNSNMFSTESTTKNVSRFQSKSKEKKDDDYVIFLHGTRVDPATEQLWREFCATHLTNPKTQPLSDHRDSIYQIDSKESTITPPPVDHNEYVPPPVRSKNTTQSRHEQHCNAAKVLNTIPTRKSESSRRTLHSSSPITRPSNTVIVAKSGLNISPKRSKKEKKKELTVPLLTQRQTKETRPLPNEIRVDPVPDAVNENNFLHSMAYSNNNRSTEDSGVVVDHCGESKISNHTRASRYVSKFTETNNLYRSTGKLERYQLKNQLPISPMSGTSSLSDYNNVDSRDELIVIRE